jgi:hypothetical protein
MQYYDPVKQRFPRNPAFMICDDEGRRLYPLGKPTSNDEGLRYAWSDDNMKEVELGILKRADSLCELAQILGVDAARLKASSDGTRCVSSAAMRISGALRAR